ncbi:MAG: ROK family protein [Muribaculaceae bacterium]|nr:ROK family protein [Muribaculaceae bacterium]
MYNHDNRIVVTLDAGGTNLVFGAMRGCEFIIDPVTIPSRADNLALCLQSMVNGFKTVIDLLDEKPCAISFAFPGPADYKSGIVGGFLPNFPSFRDGVALGPFLEREFGLPVFINNDGDLFAFGEAMAGALPEINRRVAELGGERQYRNMLGYTFGTGFGIGEVIDGSLNLGNNSCVETFCLPSGRDSSVMVEDFVSIRAIVREYRDRVADAPEKLTPKDICDIADGNTPGDAEAARESFRLFGEAAGDAMATAVTLTDSLIVVGGGLTGAARHFMPALLARLRSTINTIEGEQLGRVQMSVFDLDDEEEFRKFALGEARKIKIYGSDDTVTYDPMKRTGIIISRLGASTAISIGAYTYALSQLDRAEDKENL